MGYDVSRFNIDVSKITSITDDFGNKLGFKTNQTKTSLYIHTLDWVGSFRTNFLGDFIIHTTQVNRPIKGETHNNYILIYDPPTKFEEFGEERYMTSEFGGTKLRYKSRRTRRSLRKKSKKNKKTIKRIK